ncbi:MAG: conjugative transposon protein TraM [Bacteroidetes bacterium]|nr:conjugative transposon protein TraM [Bacteroidota bacterium]
MTTINKQAQKKFLLALPLLVVPFLTLLFWALGGGKQANAVAANPNKGLNTQLPGAQLKDNSKEDKLSFYSQAEGDSLKFKQAQKDDPYYNKSSNATSDSTASHSGIIGSANQFAGKGYNYPVSENSQSLQRNEQAINDRLAALNRQINQQSETTTTASSQPGSTGEEAAKLQETISKINSSSAPDPEMKQLGGMLDKIMEIQHPDLVQQKLKEESEKNRGSALPVSDAGKSNVSLMSEVSAEQPQQNGFYGLDDNAGKQLNNAVAAVVHETQTLTSGATIKLRLLQDIFISGQLIPKDNFVFGTCSVDGDRLSVAIKSIRFGKSVFPVSMKVIDQDGIAGIYVPGAISRDAAKEGADQAIQSLDLYSASPSIGAQAASAGVQAVKGLFSKKVKLIKVTVKAGYSVLLANDNQLNP